MKQTYILLLALPLMVGCADDKQEETTTTTERPDIYWTGAMKNVMHSGDVSGKIWLDSVNQQPHLYGLGPTEGLEKEILVVDGRPYVSGVTADGTMSVTEQADTKAPFFVYSYVAAWQESALPDSITNIGQVEAYLDGLVGESAKPFAFKISAVVDSAVVHIVNLQPGAKVSSPADAHKDLKQFPLADQEVDIIGFFSREHQAVFIHHDALTHMHLVTKDRQMMGHLDELALKPGSATVYMPVK